jgi:hypothetical protein
MYSVWELETWKSSALPLQPWFPTSGGLTPVAGRKRPQLQLRYSHPRRADPRRSCSCVAWSPNIAWFPRHSARFTEPRRADARRSREPAFVHHKNRFFADKRSHCNKSGGRKPPVGNKTPLQIATVHIRRAACVQPGAAGVSQPWSRETHLQRLARICRAEATRKPSVREHRCNCITTPTAG